MRHRAVIFDLFGTLVDNFARAAYRQVMARMAAQLGAPVEEFSIAWDGSFHERAAGVLPDVATALRTVCERLGVQPSPAQVQTAVGTRLEYTRRNLVPREGVPETLKTLRQAGLKVGLITDCTWEVPHLWESTPFAGLFDATIFSCTVRLKKPDPAIYRLACTQLAVAPGNRIDEDPWLGPRITTIPEVLPIALAGDA